MSSHNEPDIKRHFFTSSKAHQFALGYVHNLSKRTDIYAAYMNDKVSSLSGGDTFGGGVRMKF